MDPISATAWLQAGSTVLGAALKPSPSAPSYASSGVSVNAPDFGGFNVNFGAGGSVSASNNSNLILAAVAAGVLLVALVWIKKK